MKTTEIFIEQVLIGLLVLFIVGILALPGLADEIVDTAWNGFGTAAILVAAAYIVGIVYDRTADTLLEDLERHHRLAFALRELASGTAPGDDPFPENRYRVNLFRSEAAVDQAHYLRIRLRLTRSLATLTPALSVALVVVLAVPLAVPVADGTRAAVAGLLGAGYAAAFGTRLLPERSLDGRGETGSGRGVKRPRRVKLPRTGALRVGAVRERYLRHIKYDETRKAPSDGWLGLALRTEPVTWILLAVTAGSALLLGRGSGWSPVTVGLPLGGLALTLFFGWTWWRISGTYFTFLRDFDRYFLDRSN